MRDRRATDLLTGRTVMFIAALIGAAVGLSLDAIIVALVGLSGRVR